MDADEHHEMESEQEIPRGQTFMDNLFWLFLVSLLLSLVIYNGWGLIEIMQTSPAP